MTDQDANENRGLSAVDRLTDPNTVEPVQKDNHRLDDREALLLLFSLAMLPSFVIPTKISLGSDECTKGWLWGFLGIIVASALLNFVTLNILNKVASVKQMDSYQEVAYNISNSNRGYIFLISAAKFIFLAITAAFAMDYVASYLTELVLLRRDSAISAGGIYGVYLTFVVLLGGLMFYPYHRLRGEQQSGQSLSNLRIYALVFGVAFVLQFLIYFVTMAFAAGKVNSGEHDNTPGGCNGPWTTHLGHQLTLNGHKCPTGEGKKVQQQYEYVDENIFEMEEYLIVGADADEINSCQNEQAIIGYIPALFYSNMFSIYFLEIKSLTKLSEAKAKSDYCIGLSVISAVTLSYFLIYVVILIGFYSIKGGDNQSTAKNPGSVERKFLMAVYDSFISMPQPFRTDQTPNRDQMNFFDLNYILISIMMLCQAMVLLQIARENLITFVSEHINQTLSKTLDWKNRGMETKNKQLRRGGQEQAAPAFNQGRSVADGNNASDNGSSQGLLRQGEEAGSIRGTVGGVNAASASSEQRAAKPIPKGLCSALLYASVVSFALLNCESNNILAHLWVVIASIVCPLLDMFIPGIFYFKVMKEEEDDEEGTTAGCNKFYRCMARFYTFLGAVFLPLLLTLSTKALFSTSNADNSDVIDPK